MADTLFETRLDRRRLLRGMVMGGAGATLAACTPRMRADIPNLDPAILTFALNLEYLEAAYYLAAIGELERLPGSAEIRLPDGVDGSRKLPFRYRRIEEVATEIALDELAHVEFLRAALGSDAAERPVIDLDAAFKAAAAAAFATLPDGGAALPFTPEVFDPFAAEVFFLHGAFIFEDVGVSAYKGAARFIRDAALLRPAAGILAAEAYHAGTVRSLLYGADGRAEGGELSSGFYGPLPIWNIVEAISDARDFLSGPQELDQGVTVTPLNQEAAEPGGANIVPADADAVAFGRSPRQVANIVFLSPDASAGAGGFFPEGVAVPAGLEREFALLLSPDFPADLIWEGRP